MRQIDWEKALSEEDKVWLRQSGMALVEERIAANEAKFGQDSSLDQIDIPPDPSRRSALDPTARGNEGPVATGESEAKVVEDEEDDYDDWKVSELSAEVDKRNTELGAGIVVTGTGANGALRKPDYIDALRKYDRDTDVQSG